MERGLHGVDGVERTKKLRNGLKCEILTVAEDGSGKESLSDRRSFCENKLEGLLGLDQIAYIEEDQEIHLDIDMTPMSPTDTNKDTYMLGETQYDAPWGLDRIDKRENDLDGLYHYDYTGAGVNAYILDTGILSTHNEFGGRVTCGYNGYGNLEDDCEDRQGHGTHVAGTVGGVTTGVAKEVNLITVKVLSDSGSGSNSIVLEGMDWVAGQASDGGKHVANMSLGSSYSRSTNNGANALADSNCAVIVAAGNSNIDASRASPASASDVYTVGSTSDRDWKSSFSNYGDALDLFAPGENIYSAWFTGDNDYNAISGTSMACPHVAGTAALYMEFYPSLSVDATMSNLLDDATSLFIRRANGSPQILLYTGATYVSSKTEQK